jgi:uncharacterized protein (TIGR04255 family)
MLFSDNARYSYASSPLIEVICQLRFPTILSIGSTEPAQFQEAVRADFPRYLAQQEQQPPRVVNPNTPQAKLEPQPPITNYNFISTDGLWKINMTHNFIALSTLRYTTWEDFAQKLDKVLALFIQIYQPAFFERIGLRYVNAFSRKRLGLEGELWDDLINAPFIGVLSEPDVDEKLTGKCALDVEMSLGEKRRMKLHAGPGLLNGGKQDPEPKFILDGDFSVLDKQIPAAQIAQDLGGLHDYAVRLFNAAITKELHDAMGPTPLG